MRDFRYGLHTSPKARYTNSICADALDMFATQTRDLSHIELERSDNISSKSFATAYRDSEAVISTKKKNKSKNRRNFILLLLLFLLIGFFDIKPEFYAVFFVFYTVIFTVQLLNRGYYGEAQTKASL